MELKGKLGQALSLAVKTFIALIGMFVSCLLWLLIAAYEAVLMAQGTGFLPLTTDI